jgi:hypothetical protein
MGKIMIGVFIGVFAGAFARELLERARPGLLDSVRKRAIRAASDVKFAFRTGYETAAPIAVESHASSSSNN